MEYFNNKNIFPPQHEIFSPHIHTRTMLSPNKSFVNVYFLFSGIQHTHFGKNAAIHTNLPLQLIKKNNWKSAIIISFRKQTLPCSSGLVPGFAFSQAMHFVASALFCTKHISQSQLPSGFLNLSSPRNPPEGVEKEDELLLVTGNESPRKQRKVLKVYLTN